MVRSGELPSRLTALRYGADLVWGPEIIDKALLGTVRRENLELNTVDFVKLNSNNNDNNISNNHSEQTVFRVHASEKPRLICQIGTASPSLAVQAARLVAKDVSGIDINAGCPLPFSTLGGMGSALLRTPALFLCILETLVKEVGYEENIAISTKIRILKDPKHTEQLVRSLVKTGIVCLSVHCRTSEMRASERAIRSQLQIIGDICRDAGVACLMNGDITSRDEALRLAREYGVDGAMIAVAAQSDFSVFRSDAQGGRAPWQEVVREYAKLALSVENHFSNTKHMFGRMIPGKSSEFLACQSAKGYTDICLMFGLPKDRAQFVDAKRRGEVV